MRRGLVYILLLLTLGACKNDVLNTGASILPEEDAIIVSVDTFSVRSSLDRTDYIYSSPDSMLLGECDSRFGTIHADILTQLACPEGYQYEDGAVLDSVCIYVSYSTWFGDGMSPMSLSVYELDKATFSYTQRYKSSLDVSDYWSGEDSTYVLDHDRIIVAGAATDSAGTGNYYVSFKTNDRFANRFFNIRDFSSQEAYTQLFKGFYITTGFGSSTMLHVNDISLAVFYHYTYSRAGVDTLALNEKWFYANSEVRSINRINYTNSTFEELRKTEDSVNYIVSPANLQTRLGLPMREMADSIKKSISEKKRPYVNLARLQIDVLNVYTGQTSQKTSDDWAQPAPYMLLLKEDSSERFFTNKEFLTDTCAIISPLTSGTDSVGNTIYYYDYDITTLLTRQLRTEGNPDTLYMLLVPVSVEISSTSSTTTISAVYPMQTVSATAIRSAQDKQCPMRLEVVYSGF